MKLHGFKIIGGMLTAGLLFLALPALAFGTLSVSQTNVNVNVGQNVTVNVSSPGNQTVNITSITNTYVAYANISNNVVTIYGLANGNSQIELSTFDNYVATIYVSVGSGGYPSNQISFSQNNLNLNTGQNQAVTIYSNSGETYYISNNSNSNVVNAYVAGTTLNLYAQNSGSSTITVRSNQNSNNYGTVYVTVNGGYYGNLSFSQNNINLSSGQNSTISVYNVSGSLSISSNSNSNVASAYIQSNNQISIYANNSGSTTLTVSSSSGQYGTIYITVSGGYYNNLSFNQSSISLSRGQSTTIYVYNVSGNLYISNNSNSNVASASIQGTNQIIIFGNNSGNTTLTVATSTGQQGTVYVTVSGGNSYGNLYLVSTNPSPAATGQYYSYQFQVSGGTNPYYFSQYSGSLPPGLNLSQNGTLSGIPTVAGNYNFQLNVRDYYNNYLTYTPTIYLNVTGGSVAGTSIYANGTLLNENGTISIVYKNTKSGFGNLAAFQNLGYKLQNVINGSDPNLMNSGFVIAAANVAHPWGSWIKSGNTIYFVHQQGLIPIASYDIFLNNGGVSSWVVSANAYDFYKPTLDLMINSDSRLR